jgi:hypothetical protein
MRSILGNLPQRPAGNAFSLSPRVKNNHTELLFKVIYYNNDAL